MSVLWEQSSDGFYYKRTQKNFVEIWYKHGEQASHLFINIKYQVIMHLKIWSIKEIDKKFRFHQGGENMLLNRNLFKNMRSNCMQGMTASGSGMPAQMSYDSQMSYMFQTPMAYGGYPGGAVKYGQPVVYPTQVNMVNTYETTVVPVIHPQHTKVIHNELVQMQHYYPNTVSAETKTACINQNCGCR